MEARRTTTCLRGWLAIANEVGCASSYGIQRRPHPFFCAWETELICMGRRVAVSCGTPSMIVENSLLRNSAWWNHPLASQYDHITSALVELRLSFVRLPCSPLASLDLSLLTSLPLPDRPLHRNQVSPATQLADGYSMDCALHRLSS